MQDPTCSRCGVSGYGRCPCWYTRKIPGQHPHRPDPKAQAKLEKLIVGAYRCHQQEKIMAAAAAAELGSTV